MMANTIRRCQKYRFTEIQFQVENKNGAAAVGADSAVTAALTTHAPGNCPGFFSSGLCYCDSARSDSVAVS